MSFKNRTQGIYSNWYNYPGRQPTLLQLSGVFFVHQNDVRYILSSSANEQRIDSDIVLSASNIKINEKLSSYNSHLILSSSIGSNVTISGSLYTEENYKIGGTIYSFNNLILSSSNNSKIAFSGSIDLVESDKNYHIAGINSDLILSSSSTSKMVFSGTIFEFTDDAASTYGNVVSKNSHLILSSGVGSIVTISGGLNVVENNAYGTIRGGNIYLNNAIRLTTETVGTHGLQVTEQDGTVAEFWVNSINHASTQTINTGAGCKIQQNKDTNINGAYILRLCMEGSNDEFIADGNNETQYGLQIIPDIQQHATNQVKFIDFLIATTETQIGGRGHDFVEYRIGKAAKYRVTNGGDIITSGTFNAVGNHLILDSEETNVVSSGTIGTIPWTTANISTGSYKIGQIAYVSDGDGGSKCLSMFDGTDWKVISLGATIDNGA